MKLNDIDVCTIHVIPKIVAFKNTIIFDHTLSSQKCFKEKVVISLRFLNATFAKTFRSSSNTLVNSRLKWEPLLFFLDSLGCRFCNRDMYSIFHVDVSGFLTTNYIRKFCNSAVDDLFRLFTGSQNAVKSIRSDYFLSLSTVTCSFSFNAFHNFLSFRFQHPSVSMTYFSFLIHPYCHLIWLFPTVFSFVFKSSKYCVHLGRTFNISVLTLNSKGLELHLEEDLSELT